MSDGTTVRRTAVSRCSRCRYTLGTCATGTDCTAQPQCLGCLFWYGTGAFGGDFCEVREQAPEAKCPSRLEPPPAQAQS